VSGDLSRSLVDAEAEAIGAAVHMPGSRAQAQEAVAAVLETLAVHYYERAALRGEASGDGPTCDGECDNDDCHMTSAVAAWQMAAATAQRVTTELREAT
jgi:hypothetical protein